MTATRIRELSDLGRFDVTKFMVPMNRLSISVFSEEPAPCLATEHLNSCRAVVIFSKQAAILAHIGRMRPVIFPPV